MEWIIKIIVLLQYIFLFATALWALGTIILVLYGDVIEEEIKRRKLRKSWELNKNNDFHEEP